MKELNRSQTVARVSIVAVCCNLTLAALKLAAGLLGNSVAVVSDAANDVSDLFSTLVVFIGVRLAAREPDSGHPYGHERFECVAAILLAAVLAATGAGIGYGGVRNILGDYRSLPTPGLIALAASIVSIFVKEFLFHFTRRTAKRIDSGAMMADAWHHRSDSLASLGSLVGIVGARAGLPVLDSAACLVICAFVIKAALDIFLDAVGKMTDRSCDSETEDDIRGLVLAQAGVLGVDLLRTRRFGDRIYIDVEISADGELSLQGAHELAHRVHDAVETRYAKVKHCMVHVNPREGE